MKVIGKMILEMDMEDSFGLMEKYMKGIGKIVRVKGKGFSIMKMVRNSMKGFGMMVFIRIKVLSMMKRVRLSMMGNGKMVFLCILS